MSDFVVLGTDTDAGKTTFALLWLTAFGDEYAYWKPVESGNSDTERVRRLVPGVTVFEPRMRLREAVAPPLAARREGVVIPAAADLAAGRPACTRPLLIETFGGPLSPLNDAELQVELIRRLDRPCVLVTSSTVGAVGRSLTTLRVLRAEGVRVLAVVLVGPPDDYALTEVHRFGDVPTFSLAAPTAWDTPALIAAVAAQRDVLGRLRVLLNPAAGERPDPASLVRRDARSVWHPYTSLRDPDPPLPVAGAEAEFLHLADGRRVIDAISCWWTILHGHRHPPLMQALQAAAGQFDHVLFAGATHEPAVALAECLLAIAPWPGGRVFYSDNGSTAVEVALKLAYQFWCHRGEPHRRLFVGFEGAYHGDTFGAMAVGRDRLFFGRFEPLLFQAVQVPLVPDRLDETLAKHRGEVAAVIVEPLVQGAGGMRMHSPSTLRDLAAVARRHDVLFIADEVMTGGRTGPFWAHAQAGIAPDLVCAAKTLAGGVLPLAVTLASPAVVRAFDTADREKTFFHGHSFTAHPLACAVAVANMRLVAGPKFAGHVERVHRYWQSAVERLAALPGVRNVRVCGTILALDVGPEDGYLADVGRRMRSAAVERDVLLRPLGNVLYALPPVQTSAESLGRIIEAMEAAVRAAGD